MKKLILAGAAAMLVNTGAAWAVCSANIQMNAEAPTDASGNTITNVPLPTNDTDVATKAYVDSLSAVSEFAPMQAAGTFKDAVAGCAALEQGGFDDWYLPSFEQMSSGISDITGITVPLWTASYHERGEGNASLRTYNPSTYEMGAAVSSSTAAYICLR